MTMSTDRCPPSSNAEAITLLLCLLRGVCYIPYHVPDRFPDLFQTLYPTVSRPTPSHPAKELCSPIVPFHPVIQINSHHLVLFPPQVGNKIS